MDSLHRLEEIFAKFPGIGPRQARRFVYYLLNKPTGQINEFIRLVEEVKKSANECTHCHRIFVGSAGSRLNSSNLCAICSDPTRDKTILMIVSRDSDFETIEKSSAFKGLYFILGGTIPILDKEPDKRIRLESLLRRISLDTSNYSQVNSANFSSVNSSSNKEPINEIILSLNTTPDGEHTANIVHEALNKILNGKPVKISVLGRGLSTGAELEYVDSETIKSALKNRS